MRLRYVILPALLFAACTFPAAGQTSATSAACPETVTIETGDTLGAIAARCGTTVAAIRDANPEIGDPRRLQIGTEIRLPAPTGEPDAAAPAQAATTDGTVGAATGYVIRQGDTWDSIAQQIGVDVETLMEANPEIASVALNAGTRIAVPSSEDAKGPPPELPTEPAGTASETEAATSGSIGVSDPGEATMGLRVVGKLTDEGVECPALRSLDGTLYTLSGDVDQFKPGDDVVVTGRKAEMSTCMQGTTIAVEKIAPAS